MLVDGRSVPLPGARQRALLAILLLHAGEVVSSDRLIDALWPGRPPDSAANALQATVSRLRKLLQSNGRQPLITRPPGYVVEIEPDELDLRRFETLAAAGRDALRAGEVDEAAAKLREALSEWRGRAVADLDVGSMAQTEVARLEDARLDVLEQRIEADVALGRHAALAGELEALSAKHPYRETFRRQLMLALYRAGRQAEALEVYRATRRLLADELGLEPSEELRRLHAAMLRQDPALLGPIPADPSRPLERRRTRTLVRQHRAMIAIGALLLVAGIAALVFLVGGEDHALDAIPPRSVGRIDIATDRITAAVPVGQRAAAIAGGHGSIWVANTHDGTVVRIDPHTSRPLRTLAVGGHPSGLAVDRRSVWVRNAVEQTVVRVDPAFDTVGNPIAVGAAALPAPIFVTGIAARDGSVWTAAPPTAVVQIDGRAQRVARRLNLESAAMGPIAFGARSLWVGGASALSEVQVETGRAIAPIRLSESPTAIVSNGRPVWVAAGNAVQEIDGRTHTIVGTVEFRSVVTALALGGNSVWAASGSAVFRIDPTDRRVIKTIRVGRSTTALAVANGAVWVGVS